MCAAENLYVHFPFCRSRCSYCALYSRAGVEKPVRDGYARSLCDAAKGRYRTVYFGGGSPALCDLRPLLACVSGDEFTVELHPLDVTPALLALLREGGVNRISMGVQSLDDATLAAMGRGYSADEAERAFRLVRDFFDNAGIDLIVGYPGDPCVGWEKLKGWGLRHCSVYSLQNERALKNVPNDDFMLDKVREVAEFLGSIGLERYEISNYAAPGYECRHNLAVWRGEDYLGVGEGACGRLGRRRTPSGEVLSEEEDEKERTIFRLRTREGLDASRHPEWEPLLARHCQNGLLVREGAVCRLTPRGAEVCDSILADLV